jgi:hypothetical protein
MGRSGLPTSLIRASAAVGVPGAVVLAAWGTGALGTLGLYAPMAEYRMDAPPESGASVASRVPRADGASAPAPAAHTASDHLVGSGPTGRAGSIGPVSDEEADVPAVPARREKPAMETLPSSSHHRAPAVRSTMMTFGPRVPGAPVTATTRRPSGSTGSSARAASAPSAASSVADPTPTSSGQGRSSSGERAAGGRHGLLSTLSTSAGSVSVLSFG